MPEKVIYTITDSGNDYFQELMVKFSKTPSPIFFDFNAFLINLDLVDKDSGIAMLRNLRQHFQNSYANLKKDREKSRSRISLPMMISMLMIFLNLLNSWWMPVTRSRAPDPLFLICINNVMSKFYPQWTLRLT